MLVTLVYTLTGGGFSPSVSVWFCEDYFLARVAVSNRKPNKITRIFDRILGYCAGLGAGIVFFMMLGIVADVTLRHFWNLPIPWMLEVTEYGVLWITFLVAAWLLRSEGHVKMDLVVNRLKLRTQSLVNIITSVFGTIAVLVVTWYAAVVTWDHIKWGTTEWSYLEPLIAPIQVIIPIGSFLLFIQLLRRSYGYWQSWRVSRTEESG